MHLCYRVFPIFLPLLLSTQMPHSLRQSPHNCPCPWVMPLCSLITIYTMLYLDPHDHSVPINLYLIPTPFLPNPPNPLTSGNHQNILRICDSASVMLVHLFCFLDSIIDRCIYYHFIVHIFDPLLNKEDLLTFHIIMVWR